MAAERLFLLALALVGGDHPVGGEQLKQKDALIASLFDLQRRVRAGELPTDEELALGRVSRERILSGLDVRVAKKLGIDPAALKNRLIPGFSAELDQLVKRQPGHDLAPSAEPSPLLTLVLDVEQQLFAAADRRRQRVGIKSPIDSGPLSQRLEAPNPAPTAEPAPAETPTAALTRARVDAATKGADPRAVGKALYRTGRYADALNAWEQVRFDDPATSLELHYMHSDALFRTGRPEEAIKGWEKLATAHADTSFGQQADFALRIARAMVALKGAREEAAASSNPEQTPPSGKPPADAKKPVDAKGQKPAESKTPAANRPKDGEGHAP